MNNDVSNNVMTTPRPNPTPMQGPLPLNEYQMDTIYRVDNFDGTYSIIDRFSNKELYTVNQDGSVNILNGKFNNFVGTPNISNVSYDESKSKIIVKNSDGSILATINNGKSIDRYSYDEYGNLRIAKYNSKGTHICTESHDSDGKIRVYSEGRFIKTINADGSYETYEDGKTIMYDSKDHKIKTLYKDKSYDTYENNYIIKHDNHGEAYEHLYEDGKMAYLNSDKENLVIYPNGTFYNYKSGENGKYIIDNNGHIICMDNQNNRYTYDSKGKILQSIDKSGKVTIYDYDTMKKTVTSHGKSKYYRINHIEYDEEAYNIILRTLNDIDSSSLNELIFTFENSIFKFPDTYPTSGLNYIGNGIDEHYKLIKSLSEMTNYSLLAYQACDSNLKDNLNDLVDSLFDNKQLENDFKTAIGFTIEDSDNDGILEYKKNTDFSRISEELLPTQKYVDVDGNILYFNNKGHLLSSKGNNIKITYGGENFTLNFGANGCAILKDSKGNPINIFGDYNTFSKQYGGNQKVFYMNPSILNDKKINDVLEKYFPGASYEDKFEYLNKVGQTGCGYVTTTNMAFKMLEGHEEDFQNIFKYPMYDITYQNNEVSVDYNYEPLTLELYSKIHGKNGNIEYAIENARGILDERFFLEKYLSEEYNIPIDNKINSIIELLSPDKYNLYNKNGEVINCNGGHSMTITEENDVGETYVSSWGEKYRYESLESKNSEIHKIRPYDIGDFYSTTFEKDDNGNCLRVTDYCLKDEECHYTIKRVQVELWVGDHYVTVEEDY